MFMLYICSHFIILKVHLFASKLPHGNGLTDLFTHSST